MIKYLFDHTDVKQLNTVVLPYNVNSNKVIQKCGFRFNGNIEIGDQQHYHYTLNKEEWKSKNSITKAIVIFITGDCSTRIGSCCAKVAVELKKDVKLFVIDVD